MEVSMGGGAGWGGDSYVRAPDRGFWYMMRPSQGFSAGRDGMGFSSRLLVACSGP